MHVLLTGVAGFIASGVAKRLVAEGHTVTGVDNMNDAYDVRLKEFRLREVRPLIEFIEADICDRDAMARLFSSHRFDAVINLAARAGVRQSVENPWVYFDTNATGTLNLLDLCRRFSVSKFLLASTSSLYGDAKTQPFTEAMATDTPLSPYAASKKAAEMICHTYHHLHGIDVSIVRYFTVYGPAGRPDMSLFRFTQWVSEGRPVILYGDGSQSRDFTYVDDIARGTVLAATKRVGYEIINLGSDAPWVLIDTLRLIEALAGKKAQIEHRPMHAADVKATWADVTKAKTLLGWKAEVDAKTGITRLVDWYRANREWAKDVETG
ncbi:MAG: SDR family NAD(P)-dependent oxidoreductase [Deltaproteobacteria bacterium]|nr:SDR family NAD(P)-dependent oxidoreductase [Deltaproteobacteria bacterium]